MRSPMLRPAIWWPAVRQLAVRSVIAMLASLPGTMACAQATDVTLPQVKVALVYNFIMYTEWPVVGWNTDIPFIICVSAKSELRDAIQVLQARTIHNRRVRTKVFTENSDAGACDVLYIDGRSFSFWPQIRKGVAGKSILTVSSDDVPDNEGFIISMVLENDRLAFQVDSNAAREANLAISSKLLRLARRVY